MIKQNQKDPTINKTRFIYGAPFINLIKDIVNKLDLKETLHMEKLCVDNTDLNILDEILKEIRNYAVDNQHKFPGLYPNPDLRLTTSSNSFPDHYAIIIACTEVDNLGEYKNFTDMLETLRKNDRIELENLVNDDHVYGQDDRLNCACGHTICMNNSFLVRSKQNGMTLLLGIDCIEKNEIILDFLI